ncbi:hypothetical protein [Bacillus bingmayongensis]|nr:hypothetical protein [Bacillus bingmayongensis]MBY0597736.1 hypothetical protein [Bacillus bingmayongensis]
MKTKLFTAILAIAAAATFTFAPVTKQDKVQEAYALTLYQMDPNPGGG